jgi:diguanylate cyclase
LDGNTTTNGRFFAFCRTLPRGESVQWELVPGRIAVSENVPVVGSAADIARAALRHMALHRMPPTPENYASAWEVVGGSSDPRTLPMNHGAGGDAAVASAASTAVGAGRPGVAAEAAEAVRNANRRSRLMASMTELIETVCTVVPTLVEDEQWVKEQFAAVRKAVHPEQGLPDRGELAQARQLLLATAAEHQKLLALRRESLHGVKGLLGQWVTNMGRLAQHGREYGEMLGSFARRVQTVGSLDDLATTLASTIEETGVLSAHLDEARSDLEASCDRAEELENKVSYLSEQLSVTSAQLMTDHLTDLLNRRGLEETFHRVWQACAGHGRPLSLVLLDIDDFKRVNDSLGHPAGDEALRQFAIMLKSRLRPDDTASRYGGEEFVLLLPGAPLDGAVEMVRRLQRAVAEQALLGGPNRMQLTFSGGVTQVADGNLTQALDLADDALYEAKRTGKNRVCSR